MPFEPIVLRMLLWVGLPIALVVLAVGPRRVWGWTTKAWNMLWTKRLDPEEVLTQVVQGHQKHLAAMRQVLAQSEAADNDLGQNLKTSEQNIAALEQEARKQAQAGDDLGARAALYRLNLERTAVESFRQQQEQQRNHIAKIRRHLYLVELQLRQYEVGRKILLSQLAEAKTIEQQSAIAAHFDPFNAVANWQQAEGIVLEKSFNSKAIERVYADMLVPPITSTPAPAVDPAMLDAQLADLKERITHRNKAKQ